MIKKTILDALNKHVNAELFSAYIYYAMSAYFEAEDLSGMANWMRIQAQEELLHVTKFYEYINDRDGRVLFGTVEAPPAEWDSPLAAFRSAYEHECKVSALINDLVELARNEKDQATYNFLQWFVAEQVEEEAAAKAIVGQLKLVGDNGQGLFMVDRELGGRTFTAPAASAE